MKVGFVSDSLGGLPLTDLLNIAAHMGVSGVEVNTCGWSTAPHFDLKAMQGNATKQRAFKAEFEGRGLEVIGLNANGNPLHPTDPAQGEDLKNTIRVAGEMGIKTVCTLSGLAAGNPTNTMPNWVVSSWPPATQAILRYQWEEKLLPFWTEIVALAKSCGVERIVLELHGNQCVYNVPSLLKLRQHVGPTIGANLDPSHLYWMGADALIAAKALDDAIYYVDAKDPFLNAPSGPRPASLRTARSWTSRPATGLTSPSASATARNGGGSSDIASR